MYDDNSSMEPSNKKRRMNMTLDLQQLANTKPKIDKLQSSDLLATPDLGMFMLASPDLERFIIQPNGLLLTTPTPTSFVPFQKSVTEEQEAYARGFIDALAELHKNSPTSNASTVVESSTTALPLTSKTVVLTTSNPTMNVASTMAGNYLFPASSQLPMRMLPTMVVNNTPVKMESFQTVPAVPILPPTSSNVVDIKPIDMVEQENEKLERKRARNRQAATRCRNRKLERIARLEERVAELKSQNSQLMQSAASLRDEVCRLKRGINEHTRRGCQVMITHNLM